MLVVLLYTLSVACPNILYLQLNYNGLLGAAAVLTAGL